MASAEEIFDHHLEAFGAGDLNEILTDFTDQTVMIYGDKVWRGVEGARDFFNMWLDDLLPAGCKFELIDKIATDDMVYITWTAESDNYVFDYGTDTFVMKDDKVWRQTVATHHRHK
ncbi:MAG: nuclear transport factor 2 family protein [Pseudomonadota bacterium]